ncbi:MAG TPA: DUF3887 domain-containing protein [Caulobacteraceae bacterium]|nr:DUF3887 domain-containing protein [Caulobacteraceae bacterium]
MRAWAGLAAAIALAGCSMDKELPATQAAIDTFHAQLNAGSFDAIYQGASADMKQASTEDSLVKLLAAVHRKLGGFQTGKLQGWNENYNTGGHFVTVGYAATYDKGSASETFTYRLDGDHVLLAGFNINSNALIEN